MSIKWFYTLTVEEELGGYPLKMFVEGLTVESEEEHCFEVAIPYLEDSQTPDMDTLVDMIAGEVYTNCDSCRYYLVPHGEPLVNSPFEDLYDALEFLLDEGS